MVFTTKPALVQFTPSLPYILKVRLKVGEKSYLQVHNCKMHMSTKFLSMQPVSHRSNA